MTDEPPEDDVVDLADFRDPANPGDIPVELSDDFDEYHEAYLEALQAVERYQEVAINLEAQEPEGLIKPGSKVQVDVDLTTMVQRCRLKLIDLLTFTAETGGMG